MKITYFIKLDACTLQRNRLLCLLIILTSFSLALGSRIFGEFLPIFIADYAGDYFSGYMGFGLIALIFPQLTNFKLSFISLIFCYAVEIQQLYKAQWIINIRDTKIGGLILGHDFIWTDIYCLTAGVISLGLLENFYIRSTSHEKIYIGNT